MIASLNTGVSALKGFQRGMDVVGNNIANANTYGFKSERVEYKDSFYDTLNRSVTANSPGVTSTANQVGLGLNAQQVSTDFNQGSISSTNVDSDVAIEGRGFFRVIDESTPALPKTLYTRAGNFHVDSSGYLVTGEGYYVQGQSIGNSAVTMVATGSSDGQGVPADGFAVTSSNISSEGTFTKDQTLGLPTSFNGGAGYLDTPKGSPKVTIIGDGAGAEAQAIITNGVITGVKITNAGSGYTNAVVRIDRPPANDLRYSVASTPALGAVTKVQIKTPKLSITPPATSSGINAANVDTLAPKLQSYAITRDGNIDVVLENGEKVTVGRLLLQDFMAPQALSHQRGTFFKDDGAAGAMNTFTGTSAQPGANGLGILQQGALELSNASMTDDFADLILTQRSFQGAARIITTSDEMLKEAITLKR